MDVGELRSNLSRCLRRVREGESLVITDHGKPIAKLAPFTKPQSTEHARALVRKGIASWRGGKPKGILRPPRARRRPVSAAVIEDRR